MELNLFHRIHMDCSMDSSGIHVEPMWNPCGIDHSILIPHGIHDVHGIRNWLGSHSMDSIRNNLGKVKTLSSTRPHDIVDRP